MRIDKAKVMYMKNCSQLHFNGDKYFTMLNNGVLMPILGIGTGIIKLGGIKSIIYDIIMKNGSETKKAIKLYNTIITALNNNGIMFDTSRAYGMSEKILGYALNNNKKNPKFIITKLRNRDQIKGNVRNALFNSLKELRVEYVDLYLMHWPQTGTYVDCWLEMEELYREGLVKAIGVSNFHQHHIEKILSVSTVVPAVNEFERHPLFTQKPLIEYCTKLGIKVVAYTPIARMHNKIKNNEIIINIAKKYNKSIAQVILRWDIQQGIIPIPHTLKKERVCEYLSIFDFELTESELIMIDSINENLRLRYDPDNCDFSKL